MLNITIDKQYITDLHGYDQDKASKKYSDIEIGVLCKYSKYRISYISDNADNDDNLTLLQIEAFKEAMAILVMHWINNG